MAFCTHCGAPLPDGARFCTSCGTPVAAAPASPRPDPRQQPQPAQPQPVQPRPTQPVRPVSATTTPQGGIVIDAPEGATVTISDGPQEHSVTAPAEKGEFGAIQWDEPAPQQQPQGAAPAAEPPPKKKSVLWWVLAILVGLVIFAMKMGW